MRRSTRRHKRGTIAFAASLALALGAAASAHAAVVVPDNYPSIQAALDAVVGGSLPDGTTIEVRPGTYNEVLTISGTARSLTLHALNGPGTVTVTAASLNRSVLIVQNTTGTIQIQALRFTGGTGDASGGTGGGMTIANASPAFQDCTFDSNSSLLNGGAGVLAASNASFLRCTFSWNTAVQHGGGLVIVLGSHPTFDACTFLSNTSGTGSAIGSGGAIHANDSSPTLRHCVVTGNQSKFAGGGIFHLGVFGSANGTARLAIEDSDINGNTTSRWNTSSNPAEGGGVHIEDNAIGRLFRCRIRNNIANTGGGLNAYRARYEVESSIIEGNQAPDPLAVGGFGGGIQASSNNSAPPFQPGTVTLYDTVVRNNSSRSGGGIQVGGDFCASCTNATATKATLSLTDSLVDGNTGGGINATRAIVTVTGGMVSRNTNLGAPGYGGGLTLANGTSAALSGTHIAANQAGTLGGGIFADVDVTLAVSGSTLYRNTAGNNGGAIYVGSNGTNSGSVQTSALVDNAATSGTTIAELCPATATAPKLIYSSNTIVPLSGTIVYDSFCGPPSSPGQLTVAGLNALPSGRAGGNTGTLTLATVRSLAYFAVTPRFFPAVLAWSVMRATSVSITPPVSPSPTGDTGTVDVNGAGILDYAFSAATPLGSVGAIVTTAYPVTGGAATVGPILYHTLTPCRILDTRWPAGSLGGPAMFMGWSRTFTAAGVCGIPPTAQALSLNVTVTEVADFGHLYLYPFGQPQPATSTINFRPGGTRANNAIVGLGPGGAFTVGCVILSGSTQVIVDVTGYF